MDQQYEDGAGYARFALGTRATVGLAKIEVGFRVDYDVDSNFKRGHRQVVDILDGADWLAMPSVVLGEIEIGFRLGNPIALSRTGKSCDYFSPMPQLRSWW